MTGMLIEEGGGSRGREDDREFKRMLLRAVALAGLMTIGASGVSLASQAAYLGNWARSDGKTRIHVAACGAADLRAQHLGQTRRPRGESGRSPYSQGKASGRWALVGERLRSAAQAELRHQRPRYAFAHDHAGMRDGWVCLSKYGLESIVVASDAALWVDAGAISDAKHDGERTPWPSSLPIREQQHPRGGERRHRDEIGNLQGDVLPIQNA